MQLQIFKYQSEEEQLFNEIRTIEQEDGSVLFGATDVARVLGYASPADAVTRHCKGGVVWEAPIPNQWGKPVNQSIKYIKEGDVYRLIIRSKLPSAESLRNGSLMKWCRLSASAAIMGRLTERHYLIS